MAKQNINIGAAANDRRGDSLRAAFQKVNANFTDLYTQVENISTSEGVDLTGYATEQYVNDAVDAIEIPDVSNFITAADIPTDFKGSVFADDSTLLVDGVNGKIVGSIETTSLRTSETAIALGSDAGKVSQGNAAVAIGTLAGETSQGNFAVAIGREAGESSQGENAVAIGRRAGESSQGENAVAIGFRAGEDQTNNSIVINATGDLLNNIVENTFVVKPVRQVTGAVPTGFHPAYYNPTTGEFIVVVPE